MRECTFFVFESVRDFYNFRVNHAQFYMSSPSVFRLLDFFIIDHRK